MNHGQKKRHVQIPESYVIKSEKKLNRNKQIVQKKKKKSCNNETNTYQNVGKQA